MSILTGLQAARELAGAGRDVIGLYWTKTGEWYRVDASLEAADFIDGVPRGAQSLQLVTGVEGAGFVAGAGRLGRSRPLPIDVVVNCCHGGPGEDGTLQAALDLAGVAYTGPGRGRRRTGDGQAGLRRGRRRRRACPSCPECCCTDATDRGDGRSDSRAPTS